jgi:hypothetical protein
MATKDKRRFDERVSVNSEPFWFTSAQITAISDQNNDLILKEFRTMDGTFMVMAAVVEIIEAFNGSASLLVGSGTIPTYVVGSSTVTAVDQDYYLNIADITEATPGIYSEATSQLAIDLGAGKLAVLVGADTTTPVLYANLTATAATTGKARVHFLLSRLPLTTP